jgi:hypothetical protein
MAALLGQFVAAFQRGLRLELEAIQGQSEAFELALANGQALDGLRYSFDVTAPSDRLAVGSECSIRTRTAEARVTIEAARGRTVTVLATEPIDLTATPITLRLSPRFLYDRLIEVLAELEPERWSVGLGLILFGKQPHLRTATALRAEHGALNPSQQAAVQLCSDSNLAFIWGPPGTGKTATLVHVIEELRAQDQRILLTSTTNAAIDQVLAKLAARPWFAEAVAAGEIVRLGRSEEATYGTELEGIVSRSQARQRRTLDRLRGRVLEVDQLLRLAQSLVGELEAARSPQQSLFGPAPRGLAAAQLAMVFPRELADVLTRAPVRDQEAALACRLARWGRFRTLAKARIAELAARLRDLEASVLASARLVACTLTTAYLSPLLKALRFDVLITEEAGMATLPPLFYAACLCRTKAIMVGDPRQLPPIVQSREDLARRTLGRSVFDVTAPDPARSPVVAMLDVQYRMHPVIGTLVGELFYGGRLQHGAAGTEAIAARAPFPGLPVVVVDLEARTTCERSANGSSRFNLGSAEVTTRLAADAVRGGAPAVAVITPYASQAREIRQRLRALGLDEAVECSTIHRFQGRECDVVIIDLVDAEPMRPGLLLAGADLSDSANLLNVSLSRARGKLIIVAAVAFFETHAPRGAVTTVLRGAIREGARVVSS